MKVQYSNWTDSQVNDSIKIPDDYWAYVSGSREHRGRFLTISDDTFILRMYSMYLFCCGMREIGQVEIYGDPAEVRKAFIKFLGKSVYYTIGALTYTRTKTRSGVDLQEKKVVAFIEEWSDASAGAWFYNPNSGNMVQQWTLPLNQILMPQSDSDLDDEENDE